MNDYVLEYVRKALSESNRKTYDGDSNAPYRILLEIAEVGDVPPDQEGGFWCRLTIPRQADNSLGMSIVEDYHTRQEAIDLLTFITQELQKGLQ